ncbi:MULTISPECIES: Gp49 family protein [unclassified Pseudomonas]|uniref:Gp49 family protein n=1 Tax=unclassified Pseudomonas TaxID=196821 RepID=UPI001C49BA28|nr:MULTISPECIES: Gp49 family protein [unclassified Pseudomonas]
MSDDQSIEQEIQAKGLTAPRVTPADIEANISGAYYFTAESAVQATLHEQDELTRLTGAHGELGLLTFCVLVLRNGYTVTGESACASPENFDAEVGRKIARANAVNKLWPLMGYALKQQLHDAS